METCGCGKSHAKQHVVGYGHWGWAPRAPSGRSNVERVRVEPFEVRADVVVEVITLTLTSYFSRALLTPLKLTLNTR